MHPLEHQAPSTPNSHQKDEDVPWAWRKTRPQIQTTASAAKNQNQLRPTQPSTNPLIRRGTKTNDKRRKIILTRGHKVWVVAKPIPIPKANNVTVQMSDTIPITMMNLKKGRFYGSPPQGGSSANNNPPPFEDIPARAGTPLPKTKPLPKNLFESRKDWPIQPAPTSTPTIKVEAQPQETAISHTTLAPKQIREKCGLGPNCPICKNIEEDRDGDHQKQTIQQNIPYTQAPDAQQQKNCLQVQNFQQPQNMQQSQMPSCQCPQPQNFQHSRSQSFDVLDWYAEQLCLRREWEEKMERLNDKYGLDYYSSSDTESDWDKVHKYETLV